MTTLPSEITRALGDWVANNDENESTYSNINARNVLNSALNTDVRGITQTYKGRMLQDYEALLTQFLLLLINIIMMHKVLH